jgi:hypothetical protein
MQNRYRNPAQRLRATVERLPERTRRAMLEGIERNRIIVGAYTDPRSGGICPMLAAHRNGGRTDLASFALAWDAFTNARRPRLATRRELRTLCSFLELSLLESPATTGSIASAAARIRAERAEVADRVAAARAARPAEAAVGATEEDSAPEGTPSPEPEPKPEIRITCRIRLPWRRRADAKDLVAAAQERLSEQRAAELLGRPDAERERAGASAS